MPAAKCSARLQLISLRALLEPVLHCWPQQVLLQERSRHLRQLAILTQTESPLAALAAPAVAAAVAAAAVAAAFEWAAADLDHDAVAVDALASAAAAAAAAAAPAAAVVAA